MTNTILRCVAGLRNTACGTLALALIASGRVRRARRDAFKQNVITSIYFHNPNKRLFTNCIRWLLRHGYHFISAGDLIEFINNGKKLPKGAVWLSFDDGFRRLLEAVVPVVQKEHIPITIFVPSAIIDGAGLFPWLHSDSSAAGAAGNGREGQASRDALSLEELKRIAAMPEVTIGSHTVNHTVTRHLSELVVSFEFSKSKHDLECWTGKPVTCFAFPEGKFDGREPDLLKKLGYRFAATTEARFINRQQNAYLIPRFHVGDEISLPEAVCNMTGTWRTAIDCVSGLLKRLRLTVKDPHRSVRTQDITRIESAP